MALALSACWWWFVSSRQSLSPSVFSLIRLCSLLNGYGRGGDGNGAAHCLKKQTLNHNSSTDSLPCWIRFPRYHVKDIL